MPNTREKKFYEIGTSRLRSRRLEVGAILGPNVLKLFAAIIYKWAQ
jgi:hypothetical protein